MAKTEITIVGLTELKLAIKRNPQRVVAEARRFLTRGIAAYNRGILRNPWGLLDSGGGAPVATGNLRDTHIRTVEQFKATIGPNLSTAPYAVYIHHGTKKMKARPWLDYAYREKKGEVEQLYRDMLSAIVRDLAK
jgi:HK97 gp10 family phage protein